MGFTEKIDRKNRYNRKWVLLKRQIGNIGTTGNGFY